MTLLLPTTRINSLGSLHVLPDVLIVELIFTRLGAKDLKLLSEISKYFYCFSRHDFLWKLICLDRWGNCPALNNRLVFRGTWLLTYLFPSPKGNDACAKHSLITNPLQLSDVYSEYIAAKWMRSTLFLGHFYPPPPLPPVDYITRGRPRVDQIPIEDYSTLTKETFYRRYGFQNKPVMLHRSGVESWPSWEGWKLENLLEKHGDKVFRISNFHGTVEPHVHLQMRDFIHYMRYQHDEDPLYLFDPLFAHNVPEFATDYEVPKYFEQDFFSLLDPKDRPPFRWMLIGPQRTGASWHIDPSGTSAWNSLLSGHKRWALYPPHVMPPGHDPTSEHTHSSLQWYVDVYPYLSAEERPLEIVQHPGQTIYVPTGWWHMVINLDDTVAVTQNYADETNIRDVKFSMLADKNEDKQTGRWAKLVPLVSAIRPDLIPVLNHRTENELSQEFKEEENIKDLKHEKMAPEMVQKWHDRVRDVYARVHGSEVGLGDIKMISDGHNICFLTDKTFVKFFTPLHEGRDCFEAEVKANISVKHSTGINGTLIPAPKLLGHGYLRESTVPENTKWRWPFVMTERIMVPTELTQAEIKIPKRLKTISSSMGDASWTFSETVEGFRPILEFLAKSLRDLHTTNVVKQIEDENQERGIRFEQFLKTRIQSACFDQAKWRIFPNHLLEQLPSYLPMIEGGEKLVFDPKRGDAVVNIVHGDISPGNILGLLKPITDIEKQKENGDQEGENEEKDESVTDPSPRLPVFIPTFLIDFGDAQFWADPLLDLISVFVTILDCRQDLGMKEIFMPLYNQGFPVRPLHAKNEADVGLIRLAQRCMWYVLLWPSEGMCYHLVQCMPQIGEMGSWEQVEQTLFGSWSS